MSSVGEARAYALLDEALAEGAIERTGAGYRFQHSLHRAEGDAAAARRQLRAAAELFAAAGQPLDVDRCRA